MRRARRRALGCAIVPLVAALPGCAVSTLARGTPGTDLSRLRAGMARSEVENLLGAPTRSWTTPAGVEYRLYRYDRGLAPNPADAAAVGFFDVISLGLWELFWELDPPADMQPEDRSRSAYAAVSYDAQGTAVGVFLDVGEFDTLPDDGRPGGAGQDR